MKIIYSRQVYDQFSPADREKLKPVPCHCVRDNYEPNLECESCDGGGIVYEDTPSPDVAAAIEENLRSQGAPLGKSNTH